MLDRITMIERVINGIEEIRLCSCGFTQNPCVSESNVGLDFCRTRKYKTRLCPQMLSKGNQTYIFIISLRHNWRCSIRWWIPTREEKIPEDSPEIGIKGNAETPWGKTRCGFFKGMEMSDFGSSWNNMFSLLLKCAMSLSKIRILRSKRFGLRDKSVQSKNGLLTCLHVTRSIET